MAEREATVVWEGTLTEGKGRFTVGSGAIPEQAVTWKARTEEPDGLTSPEELIAAAHASCYAMALSYALQNAGHPAERLTVTAQVGFGPRPGGGMKVTHSHLQVRGKVPGLDQQRFAELAREGEQGCPVSNALRNNVEITLEATLES
jgi:osmotically inducible protein OsmC